MTDKELKKELEQFTKQELIMIKKMKDLKGIIKNE